MSTPIARIEKQLVITAGAYAAGDVVGGLLTLDATGIPDGAILNAVVLVDDGNIKAALDLRLFNALPTAFDDNAVYAPTIADLKKRITKVAIPTTAYETVNSNAIAEVTAINRVISMTTRLLYAYLVTSTASTPTYTSTADLWLALDFAPQDRG